MKTALPSLIEAYSDLADRARRAAAEDRATKELESSLYSRFRYAFSQMFARLIAKTDARKILDEGLMTFRSKLLEVQSGERGSEEHPFVLPRIDKSLKEAAIDSIRQLEFAEEEAMAERSDMLAERWKKQKIM